MEILSHIGSAKSAEYLIALTGLFSYVLFWRIINGPTPELATVKAAVMGLSDIIAGFLVPKDLLYHPGHAWAKVEPDGIVTVGMDDFSGKLVGKVDAFSLPERGAELKQGARGWMIKSGSKFVKMLSPVEGEVVDVNDAAKASPASVSEDPYGRGWLLKIKSSALDANLKNMIPRDMVSNWFENIRDGLSARRGDMAFATMYQDGGFPVNGIAKVIDPDHWEDIAAEYFLSGE